MSLDLPAPIAAYFAADRHDSDAIAQCFTEQAVVKDEGRPYRGRVAISQWNADTSARYNYSSEPVGLQHQDGKTVVTSHLVGDFFGSPVDLRFFFCSRATKLPSLRLFRELRSRP